MCLLPPWQIRLRELIPFRKVLIWTPCCGHMQTIYCASTLKTFSVTYYIGRTFILFFNGYLNEVLTKYCLKIYLATLKRVDNSEDISTECILKILSFPWLSIWNFSHQTHLNVDASALFIEILWTWWQLLYIILNM